MRVSATGIEPPGVGITAVLGPTNTGKTHRAIEQMLRHQSGMIGLPLRLLAREVYDKVSARLGEHQVALVTGEERRVPSRPRYWVCTVESMPNREVDFVAVDEIQLAAHHQRGHTFTDRLLHARGRHETWFMGADIMRPLVEQLLPTASIEVAPRLSELHYAGTHGLGSLPSRTAVVAFSAEDVYTIAQSLRQRHGGAAVVLGALSPRTRNAQVAMYQAGDVQHLVATDAIGMGLNLDVDRVVFASLHKFDGKERRRLELAEMGQIAGRAGRYTRPGRFGTLRPLTGLPPRDVEAIEGHRFAPLHRLVWRNRDLSFESIESLVESLRQRPRRPCLRLVERADDYESLMRLSRIEGIRQRSRSPEQIERLWEVCRIPDFRKLLVDSHVQLLAAIFEQIAGPNERLDEDWMAQQIRRLDNVDGDIDTLMNRIAFVRTWTYVTHREAWVPQAEHWQSITRQIEDRQSDALHERLKARFVERIQSGSPRYWSGRRSRRLSRTPSIDPKHAADSPFRALYELIVPDAPGDDDQHTQDRWVQDLVDAGFNAFSLEADGTIVYDASPVGRLGRGSELLHPVPSVIGLQEHGAGARRRMQQRLQAWARDGVEELLAPLHRFGGNDEGAQVRGLIYQLTQGLGTVRRRHASAQLRALEPQEYKRLRAVGVEFGRSVVFVRRMMRPRALRWRAALMQAWYGTDRQLDIPPPASTSVVIGDDMTSDDYLRLGYVTIAGRAVRADQLERAHAALQSQGAGPFELPMTLGSWLGCPRRQLSSLLRAMGYRSVQGGRWIPKGRGPRVVHRR